MHKRSYNFIFAVLLTLSLALMAATMAYASQQGQGTTADFARAYPWMLLSLLSLLCVILGYLLIDKDREIKAKLKDASTNFATATDKLDTTINTLFERDRDLEHRLAANEKELAEQRATCIMNRKLCPNGMETANCKKER